MRPNVLGVVGAILFLIVHGVLLWVVIPIGALLWVASFQWLGASRVSLGNFLGWFDNNVAFVLVRGPFRVFFPNTSIAWVPASERRKVSYRVSGLDLF